MRLPTRVAAVVVAVAITCGGCARPSTGTGGGLTDAEKRCADNWSGISHAEMLRMKRDRSIDGIYDWSGGYWVSYAKIMDIC